ncbi:MAG: hypothetical protein V2I57_15445 [Xanthomonadales bacterium]|jgi:hypothetical protein|nr:hypothetical protein [Xanthomonadales bacterium]
MNATPTDTEERHAPIFLTGLPRCGSSWIGEHLSRTPGVRYRYESLNLHWAPGLSGTLGHFRYQRPGTPAPPRLEQAVDEAITGSQSWKQRVRALARGYGPAALRRTGRLVLKDPTAVLLTAWLAERRPLQVTILTRHPCGFAASIRHLGWPIRLQRLLGQPDLVSDHLEDHLDTLQACLEDPLASLGGFWAATHHTLRRQATEDWVIASFEELCLAPDQAFAELSRRLDLEVCAPTPSSRHRPGAASTQKDGRQVAMAWRQQLTEEEQDRVMAPVRKMGLEEFAARGIGQS